MSKKRVLALIASVVAIIVIIGGVLWAFPLLKVSDFEVTGNSSTPEEVIVEATGLNVGDNLVRIDAGGAAAGVVDLSWVRTATVTRGWPSTVNIEVTERQAVLFSEEEDGPHLIDATGLPFVIDLPPESAVEVTGDQRNEPNVLGSVANVVASLPDDIRVGVSRVDIPSAYDITFHLHDGRSVYWGADELNHDKALAMQTVLTQEGQHWNVSNPNMVTVR